MIDIIIPVYNSRQYLPRALDSIKSQINAPKITVIIVDDASLEKYDDILSCYKDKLDIKYYRLEKNSGPGVAREFGMNHSSGDFIIFLDSDDMFYNSYSVATLYNSITIGNYDVVRSVIYEELENGYNLYKNENIGLHGKIYRRSFINANGIYFNNTRSNEDTGFNALISLCGAKYKDIDDITYIWCNNKYSITRINKEVYRDIDLENFALNMNWAFEEALKKDFFNDIYCLQNIIELYLRYARAEKQESKNRIHDYANNIYNIYKFKSHKDIKNIKTADFSKLYGDEIIDNTINWVGDQEYTKCEYTELEEFDRLKHLDLMDQYNNLSRYEYERAHELLPHMFASIGPNSTVTKPFKANWGGKNVHIGNRVWINYNLSLVDDAPIYIDDEVLIGPNCTLITLSHALNPIERRQYLVKKKPIHICKNAWLAANVTVLPGVTIGENAVIGANSLVTHDIPPNVLAYGNPCEVIKKIDE